MTDELTAAAQAWLADDPDPATRAELQGLLDAGDRDALAERFSGRLQFGTAGLRAAVGAGSMRMNRLVVRQAAAGLGEWLLVGATIGLIYRSARGADVGSPKAAKV